MVKISTDRAIEQLIADAVRGQDFSGVVRVEKDGRVVHGSAVGMASRSWGVPNRLETQFRVGSVSKMFTAVAVLQLVGQGRLSLADGIKQLLPSANLTIDAGVTVRHLLTMTSGIADWFEESGEWEATWSALCREHPISLLRDNADYLPLFAGKPALFAPGERYQYNGAGYLLLGMAIEQLTAKSYVDYVAEHVLRPAGMTGSGFVALDDVAPDVADGYLPVRDEEGRASGWRRNIYTTTPRGAADGGATCTASDLTAFARALRGGGLLPESLTAAMLTPQVSEREENVCGYTWMYGYGVMFILDSGGQVVRWGHTGEEDGVSARLYHYPQTGIDVAILANTSWSTGKLAWAIHDALVR
jgi:CubicO group peptidase (beta-lactamase class C family)